MGTCYTCPPDTAAGERRYGQPMCDNCKRRLAHYELDIEYDAIERANAPDACTECTGTGSIGSEHEYLTPARGNGRLITTRKCLACDGSGKRLVIQ